MSIYTIFTQKAEEPASTIRVSRHEAETLEAAVAAGIKETAEEWGCGEGEIRSIGVADGEVSIIKPLNQ